MPDIKPLVSIVIPVYNGSDYLAVAIDSALAQTYENVEVLVIDDGSNDGGATARIARSYGSAIRYIHKPNGGTAAALNEGLEEMAGRYFSWLSHDDVYKPNKIERQMAVLAAEGFPEWFLYSGFEEIDGNGRLIRKMVDPEGNADPLAAILRTQVSGCTTLVPKTCFDRVGPFDTRARTTHDNEMWLRIALAGYHFHYVPESLVQSRQHAAQGSRTIRTHIAGRRDWYLKSIDALTTEQLAPRSGAIARTLALKGHGDVVLLLLRRLLGERKVGAVTALLLSTPSLLLLRGRAYWRASKAGVWLWRVRRRLASRP